MDNLQLKRILECLFFVSAEPLSLEQLKKISGAEASELTVVLAQMEAEYNDRGFVLRQVGGGWQFTAAADLFEVVEVLYKPKMYQLSAAALETLSIIAYKQPVTRHDIENIRQVGSDGVVNTLLAKSLIKEVGRRETLGRPVLYGTTEQFLSFFGINALDDLPPLQDLLQDAKADDT